MTTGQRIKQILQRFFPQQYHDFRWRYGHPANQSRVARLVVEKHGKRVLAGPFAGMIYVDEAAGSAYIPKLLGSYEEELHDIVERLSSTPYTSVIDVGCAEGYYAVGMALRCPDAHIYAFDIDPAAQALTDELATINHVRSRITIGGDCSITQIVAISASKTLVICDCEGYELELFQPSVVTQLGHCDLLVELHDFLHTGLTEILLGRFRDTHHIQLLTAKKRMPDQYPSVAFLRDRDKGRALSESRPPEQQWALMTSKSAHV